MWDTKEIKEYIYIYIPFGGNCSSVSVIRCSGVEVCGEENRKKRGKGGEKTNRGGTIE